jgi:tyrosine-protein kinase Etk/Wzc
MNTSLQQLRKKTEEENDSFKSALFLGNILKNRWLVATVALLVALAGTIYALTVTPVYEANILIQIKRNAGMSREFQGDIPAATEVEILRSRSIISHAVDALHLDISVEPKKFPVLGALIMGRNKEISNPGLFGYGGYVWGMEKADISVLNLPDAMLGRSFILTVANKDEFVLSQKELAISIRGRVTEIVKSRTPYGEIEILVARIPAKPGAQFLVSRSPRFQAVEQLQKSLAVSENGKQSNIIGVSLKGSKPELLSRILNEIGTEYLRQHVAQQSEDAEKALLFYTQQLDEAKQKLQRSDDKVAQVRRNRGIFDVNEEARTLSQQSVVLQGQLAESKQKKEELLSRYLEQHPAVVLINKHLQQLTRDLADIEAKRKELAAADHELLNITRDKQINNEINAELINARNKLDTFMHSNNANVRLVDRAETPVQSVTLKTSTMIAVACLAGILLGVIASIIKNGFIQGIGGPREIERLLGLMVSAAIPHCENKAITYKNLMRNKNEVLVPPQAKPSEEAIESLRILRSTVQFLIRDSDRNIIMITGPTPGVGKSFISANFAMVMAAAGKTVLLIDCDMRSGDLHRYFGLTPTNGLSDMLAIDQGGGSLIHRNVVNNVDFISSGNFPTHPSELLSNADFGILLRTLSARYDYVLIDTPPVLNFSDALIVGVHAELIFNVVRDGVSSMNDAEEAVRRLNRAGLAVTGMILNDLKSHVSPHGHGAANVPSKRSRGYQNGDEEAGSLYTD